MFGSPYYGNQPCQKDVTGGSGRFKANYTTDPTLPAHTLYVPLQVPPPSEKLPVIIWGNGACLGIGTMFQNFLTELASHGFMVVSNGAPIDLAMTTYKDLLTSIDWVTTNPAAKKYGNIDLDKIAIAGQSCGGMEAYEASYNSTKHKLTVLFNSGNLNPFDSRVTGLKTPVAYFLGGKTDMAQAQGLRDYALLPDSVPALLADVDVGHIGTYYQMGGGRLGRAGVDFLRWKLKGEESLKPLFCSSESTMVKDGWTIKSKNGMC
jgi:Chlorophyllase enzyme